MGVSASGKSTVTERLAAGLGIPWRDGDDLHSSANRFKMASGTPLDDDDRAPWLDVIGSHLDRGAAEGGIVIACSALKRRYRDRLRAACPATLFVHLDGAREVIVGRATSRDGHFMPASLLDSQLVDLEPLAGDELGLTVNIVEPVEVLVQSAIAFIRRSAPDPRPAATPRLA
ncbi:gluconokinase [Microbacterium xanthum]|uniref:gluconokinase n=1 Tax=Microbacterium xanthum TaxID=3079794 RepID=UPI002AD29A34|nr:MULTISPECIES: gluconokinase [unclassified Microbacterium]MDZ8171171.1 gluconokinase [Microbacterium sp. KSW-48]MDZ8201688.1 gluconokinase [Microbacterium sp. SSW1-59]